MRALLAILSMSLLPFVAQAVTVSCTTSVSSLAFGIYNPLSPSADTSTGSLSVTCTGQGPGSKSVSVGVALSAGLSGSFATRRMFSGANTLDYNIYWSTAYTQVMGDGSGGSFPGTAGPFTVFGGSSTTVTGTMYGRIPALQDVAPGSYADTIVVTVTY
ncbi:MAG: spore coat protein U domain-containing protein [Proteobacteria bacterium]|nr:spore coat protein U domain-containing protein [Pseudomonadota bacterium]